MDITRGTLLLCYWVVKEEMGEYRAIDKLICPIGSALKSKKGRGKGEEKKNIYLKKFFFTFLVHIKYSRSYEYS